MNTYKTYYLAFAFSVITCFSLQAQDKKTIVASASMFSDMISNLVTDNFTIKTIVPIGADPHKYRAKPSDARMVQTADLILVNGLTFEGWIKDLIANSGTKGEVLTITEGITPISSMEYENSSDPHAWMNVTHGKVYIKNMYEALLRLAPNENDELTKNYEAYKAELTQLDQDIQIEINKIPEQQRVLITSHDAFQYFGERYGLKLEAIMGISTEAEAQTSDIMRVSKAIKSFNVPAIFIESTINPKMLKQIATDNKVEIGGELYADSLGDEDSDGSTYKKMMWHNTVTIANALSKTPTAQADKEEKDVTKNITDGMSNTLKIALAAGVLLLILISLITKMKRS